MTAIAQFSLRVGGWIDHSFGSLLLDAAVKSFVVLALAWSATWLMRSRSAAARHLVWCAGSIAILIIPILSLALPTWGALPSSMNAALYLAPLPILGASTAVGPAIPQSNSVQIAPIHQIPDAAGLLFIGWMIGAVVCLLPMIVGQMQLWKFKRHCRRNVGAELSVSIQRIGQELGISRSVQLLIADEPLMPMTWGILRAKLVLPPDAQNWPAVRRHAVLLHELAHVKRLDCLTHLTVQLTRAVYWFNPLAWVAVRRMETERERACDDLVIGGGIRQTDYAKEILEIGASYPRAVTGAMAMSMVRESAMEVRLRNILDDHATRGAVSVRHIFIAAILLALVVLPVSMLRAEPPAKPASQPAAIVGSSHEKVEITSDKREDMHYVGGSNNRQGVSLENPGNPGITMSLTPHTEQNPILVDPRNPIELSKKSSADWINQHSSPVYLGPNLNVSKLKSAQEVIIHGDRNQPVEHIVLTDFADGFKLDGAMPTPQSPEIGVTVSGYINVTESAKRSRKSD
ncbi:MAG TPA: M56 family metallopeptidase [Tepidisphaeraceae bacterium]|jgi:beta-lactamase regulating signal transducer with metallopeptidase domain|nr:M56 family metallopeptidase [Tepidisphaeraceae bacterium]